MICEKSKCTGCSACLNICPRNAIEMYEDEYGNIYPKIDEEKCINCKLCEKVCPAININKKDFKYSKRCFAAKAKDKEIYNTTSSGGIATMISNQVLENNGVVYGTGIKENQIQCIRVDNSVDLQNLKGSKYVHSYINKSYLEVKEDLENKKDVLFIGTPCQVNGLKKFLFKDYENLYTIDLICHGVPSQKILKEDLKIQKINNKEINYLSFRDKDGMNLIIKTLEQKYIIPNYESYYFYSFLKGITYRENCYSCNYARKERVGDITLGDFWGLKDKLKFDCKKGINCVLINSDKGEKIFNLIKEKIEYKEEPIEMAIKGNSQLNHPTLKPKEREIYLKEYNEKGYIKTFKKICGKKFYTNKIKCKIKKCIKKNKYLYIIFQKVKNFKI